MFRPLIAVARCRQSARRSFAKAASAPAEGHILAKKEAKARRRELFQAREERQARLQTRRKAAVGVGEKRRAFRKFFIDKKVNEEYMNRKARQAGLGWNHEVAVILTRTNAVLPDMEDWEMEYENLRAHLDQFGIELPPPFEDSIDPGSVPITDEELLKLLPEGFTPAPRVTKADETGDVKTTDRRLKTDIYLYAKQKDNWQFPTVPLKEDETLLEAAKRALNDVVGPEVEYWTISNSPCAVNMESLPEGEREAVYGTKTFFMKVYYDEGQVNESQAKLDDYAWLDSGEIQERAQEVNEGRAKFYQYVL